MTDMNTTDRALGWDDEFTNVSQDFVLLPEGEYYFEVTGMERAFDSSRFGSVTVRTPAS